MKSKMKTQTYKGKSAKQWFGLHEVMRKDFGRILKENAHNKKKLSEATDAYKNMRAFAESKGLDTRCTPKR